MPEWEGGCSPAGVNPYGQTPGSWSAGTPNAEGTGYLFYYVIKTTHCCRSVGDCKNPPAYPGNPTAPTCPSSSSGSGSGSSSSSSSKSTAIVPASWSPTGYTALFVAEGPEVRFDDVIVTTIPQRNTTVAIGPKYWEVCEPGTIEACACAADVPVAVGTRVRGVVVVVRFAEESGEDVRLVIRLTGIRKGFAGQRFPDRTRNQFEHNERFINSAYPAE